MEKLTKLISGVNNNNNNKNLFEENLKRELVIFLPHL